jgi:mannose-6-phosphate isomerase-like protein (cupin superfamily)
MRRISFAATFAVFISPMLLCAQAPAPAPLPASSDAFAVVEQAPKDRAIAFPRERLAQHVRDMDAKQLQTLRLVEGGKFSVNLRRIKSAETGAALPLTANLWVVLEGSGTLTTGGVLEAGKISGGRTRPIKAGDVVYIPSGLPHGMSGVNDNFTWLNVRWDTDWPAGSPMGAGTFNALTGSGPPARGPALPAGNQQALPYSYGGSGEVFLSREMLEQTMAGMRLKKSGNTRLIEGGRYNINLRWNGAPSNETHEQTIDTWYLLAGGGTVNTGFKEANDVRVPDTGVFAPAKPGDVFFIPSNFPHGYSEVKPDVFWLNIRWDDNYRKE